MLLDLTRMAAERGLRFVSTKRLVGKKHAVKFEDANVIYVSPAVSNLLKTDGDATLAVLKVKILPGKRWAEKEPEE